MMSLHEIELVRQLLDAYRTLREAFHHDMHRPAPEKTLIEQRVGDLLAIYDGK